MKLQEIFNQLTHGELWQMAAGGNETLGLTGALQVKVLNSVNLGVLELHKRFLLRLGSVRVVRQEGQESYLLAERFAQSNTSSSEAVQYLDDSAEPFTDDRLLKIERVYREDGCELELGHQSFTGSLHALTMQTVIVPAEVKGDYVEVFYRAAAPRIMHGGLGWNPANVEVELPWTHLEALLFYVAWRLHNPGGITDDFHEGNNYMALFEASCQRLESQGNELREGLENYRLYRNGWV